MLQLHLIRHGKTERSSASGKDFDRCLIPLGKEQSYSVGQVLQNVGRPVVFCSSAMRTRQTLDEIRRVRQLPDALYLDQLYLCDTDTYLDLIWKQNETSELLFVGHNFGISDLVAYLTDSAIELRTGEYVVIEFDAEKWNEVSAGTGILTFRHRL